MSEEVQYNFLATEEDTGARIDHYLTKVSDLLLSRSRVQKLIEQQSILVNLKSISKNYKLRLGDSILVKIKPPKDLNIIAQNIALNIVYEDKDIILVNKPQNMVVHPSNGHDDSTLVNALMYHCKGELSGINGVIRAGIVHRIDKDTSGIIVIAKNDNAHTKLAKQLEDHSMNRLYYAVVYNNLKNDTGTIDAPIGRHPVDRKKMAVLNNKNNIKSKHAVTHYTVIERFKNYTLVKLKLETGRTHQIRVHMAYIGNPLLGDFIYGKEKQPYKLKGQVLHAKSLGFIHPSTGKYIEFETELPEYFKAVLNKIK